MNKVFFQEMHAQMQPSERVIQALYAKLDAAHAPQKEHRNIEVKRLVPAVACALVLLAAALVYPRLSAGLKRRSLRAKQADRSSRNGQNAAKLRGGEPNGGAAHTNRGCRHEAQRFGKREAVRRNVRRRHKCPKR